jgi:putative protease
MRDKTDALLSRFSVFMGEFMEQVMELLAPAGSPDILKAVIDAGADAVYLGGDRFGARAFAANFSEEELLAALDFAHLRGKKIYLTVNTLLKNRELSQLRAYLLPLYQNGLDAVLVQDMGALVSIREWFPDLPLHASTQMTVTGAGGVRLLQQYGVTRVVMARETSLDEMQKIHDATGMELEAFVHGALCYCYSGQCLFSSMLGGRSGNRGRCAQPCRLPYAVSGADGTLQKDESYILSLKDFCTIDSLRKLRDAGVFSLKIEGRMKQKPYAAGVVAMYRKYLDAALAQEDEYKVKKEDRETLAAYGSRLGFTDGYLHKHNGSDMITYRKPSFVQSKEYTGEGTAHRRIHGQLLLRKNEPVTLEVWDDEAHHAAASAGIAEAAQKQPVTREEVAKRMQKTGDTAFVFGEIKVELDDGVFVPNGVLNRLRRDALEQLQEGILQDYRRAELPDDGAVDERAGAGFCTGSESVQRGVHRQYHIASTENRALLPTILSCNPITHVYLDSAAYGRDALTAQLPGDIAACRSAGKQAYVILPSIFRAHTEAFYGEIAGQLRAAAPDGFVVKNLESLAFVREQFPGAAVVCDHNLYTYNDSAVDALTAAGADRVTVPFELNRKEIFRRKNTNSEIWVYGYYPLMTTAQCICKNVDGCTHTPGVRYLVDRYKKRFAVKNCCAECYNVIYNSLPTMLFAEIRELGQYQVSGYRLHFSVESPAETGRVLRLYEAVLSGADDALPKQEGARFTNGHYKRGVE